MINKPQDKLIGTCFDRKSLSSQIHCSFLPNIRSAVNGLINHNMRYGLFKGVKGVESSIILFVAPPALRSLRNYEILFRSVVYNKLVLVLNSCALRRSSFALSFSSLAKQL